jgi:hypothetical protein
MRSLGIAPSSSVKLAIAIALLTAGIAVTTQIRTLSKVHRTFDDLDMN